MYKTIIKRNIFDLQKHHIISVYTTLYGVDRLFFLIDSDNVDLDFLTQFLKSFKNVSVSFGTELGNIHNLPHLWKKIF